MSEEITPQPIPFRRDFLQRLFKRLKEEEIRFCILRNYFNLYDDGPSDVDMLIDPEMLRTVEGIMRTILNDLGGIIIRRADFLCRSFIFYRRGELLHIDLEYCKRWKVFPIVFTSELLDIRRPYEAFFVPTPEHEMLILWSQGVGAGFLTERYRKSLCRLFKEGDLVELERVYRRAFGNLGSELLEIHRNLENETCPPEFFRRLRKYIAVIPFANPSRAVAAGRFAWWDILRIISRVVIVPGLQCTVVSNCGKFDCQSLLHDLDVAYPAAKTRLRPASGERRSRWADFKLLFKGCLLMDVHSAASDSEVSAIAATLPAGKRSLNYPQVAILDYDTAGTVAFDAVSGFSEVIADRAGAVDFLIRAVGRSFNRQQKKPNRGVFCVLLGLDGSGKTTVSRALCSEAAVGRSLNGVRYLHWIPKPWSRPELPLPSFKNIPRIPAAKPSPVAALLSAGRLVKNLLMAWGAYLLRLRPWLAEGNLLLVDRYYYNYLIDPASVRYAGPDWLLRLILPLFPQPDLLLVLEADADVLLQRKQELSPEQIRQQAVRLSEVAKSGKAIRIDANRPVAEVIQSAANAIAKVSSPEEGR